MLSGNAAIGVEKGDLKVLLGLDPRAFGVDLTGATDSTAAFQAMLNAVPATGARILIPAGATIKTAGGLTCSNPVVISGAGAGDSLGNLAISAIQCTGQAANCLTLGGNGSIVRDLVITYTGAGQSTGSGLVLNGAALTGESCRFLNVHVRKFFTNFDIQSGFDWLMDGCYSFGAVKYGVHIQNLNSVGVSVPVYDYGDQCISNCWIYSNSNTTDGQSCGIFWESGGGLKITNTKINREGTSQASWWQYGILLQPANGVTTSVFTIGNNSIEGVNNHAIAVSASAGGYIMLLTIHGNELLPQGKAVYVVGLSSAYLSGINVAYNTIRGGTGIFMDYVKDVVVGPNTHVSVGSGGKAVNFGAHCSDHLALPQVVQTGGGATLFQDDSAGNITDHNQKAAFKQIFGRELPAITSKATYVTLWRLSVQPYSAMELKLRLHANASGVGSAAMVADRVITREGTTTLTVNQIGTDVSFQAGASQTLSTDTATNIISGQFDVLFDTSVSSEVQVKVRLSAAATATDIYGTCEVETAGQLNYIIRGPTA